MKKEEIISKLKELNLDLEEIVVDDDASLVLQDIIDEANNIELICSNKYFDELNWEKMDSCNKKYFDCFTIRNDVYNKDAIISILGIYVNSLEEIYKTKKLENKKSDKKVLEKIEFELCSKNKFHWFEDGLEKDGYKYIAGVDEVGRGPLVGPVVAACVILPREFHLEGLTDSKKLSEKKRDFYFEEIKRQAISYGIGIMDEKIIDEVNIYEATKMAMKQAIDNCNIKPDHVLIDAMPLNLDIPTTSIIKGDLKSITISAASVIAKVTRDRMLYELDEKYPMYDFKGNKGYPTKKHLEAIEVYGIIDEHRRSYGPVKEYLERNINKLS